MLQVLLSGCHGKMGRHVAALCKNSIYFHVAAGIDHNGRPNINFPVYKTPNQCPNGDVLIDFSSPAALPEILDFCIQRHMPAVLAVTGYNAAQEKLLQAASKIVPLFYAANLSMGANILLRLVHLASAELGNSYDVSIFEHHHRDKADSPSGTARMLLQATSTPAKIHSVRAGSATGVHSVLFAGDGETLELVHRTDNRRVYAIGALKAAQFIASTSIPGLYQMSDLLT